MKVQEFFENIYFFSDEDLKLFEKFLLSPFFNTFQSNILVYRIIRNNIALIPFKRYNELKSIITKETGFKDDYIRKILAKLNKLYIEYIKIKGFKSDDYYNEYICCNYLLYLGNYDLLSKSSKKVEKILSDPKNADLDLFLRLYDKDKLNYNIISTTENNFDPLSKIKKQKDLTLDPTRNLFVFFISKTTINFLNYIIQCNNIKEDKFPINLEKLFSIMKTPEFDSFNEIQRITINLFYRIFKLFNNITNDKYYTSYKTYYNRIRHFFNIEFRKTQFSILLNYCYFRQRVKDADKYYFYEGLNLLYEYVENEYYINDKTNYLNSVIYRNFIINCSVPEKIKLLKSFINNHTIRLNPSEAQLMRKFGMAHYFYLNGDYKSAITEAKSLMNPKVFYKFDISNLLIKAYYELGDFESIENILHNYKEFIDNGDFLTVYDKERYSYFVFCMRKFLLTFDKYQKTNKIFEFEHLLDIIISKQSFVMKNWLSDKVTGFISLHYSKQKGKRISATS